MTGKMTGNKGVTVVREKWLGTGFQLRVSDGKKRVVFTSAFLKEVLESAVHQEISLTTFGTAALCAYALFDAEVTEITFGAEDKAIFESCSIMIDNNDLSLALDDGRCLHIPLAKQWWNKFNV